MPRRHNEDRLGEIDIITGGFPCQDISLAGRGAGITGSRSGLWREMVRAIRMVRPRFALVENVAALLGRGMGVVLGDLSEIGYDAEWDCLSAQAVGAPHRRNRIWITAYAEGCPGYIPETERKEISDTCRNGANGQMDTYADDIGNDRGRKEFSGGSELSNSDIIVSGCVSQKIQEGKSKLGNDSEIPYPIGESERYGHNGTGKVFQDAIKKDEAGRASIRNANYWSVEPNVGRVANGVPSRVDKLKGLGNAIVPQCAYIIMERLLK